MTWEIGKISTSEQIFDLINYEATHPVGIVLFGADSDFKDNVVNCCLDSIKHNYPLFNCNYIPLVLSPDPLLEDASAIVLVLPGDRSDYSERRRAISALKKFGLKTIIGIYAEMARKPPRLFSGSIKDIWTNKQIDEITYTPPSMDGFDYLVSVNENLQT